MKNTLLGSIYLALAASILGGMYVVVKVVVANHPTIRIGLDTICNSYSYTCHHWLNKKTILEN